jgi:hypothetical protein
MALPRRKGQSNSELSPRYALCALILGLSGRDEAEPEQRQSRNGCAQLRRGRAIASHRMSKPFTGSLSVPSTPHYLPLDAFRPACLSCLGMSQQNVYRYYYYYGPLSGWRDGRDGLLRALIS